MNRSSLSCHQGRVRLETNIFFLPSFAFAAEFTRYCCRLSADLGSQVDSVIFPLAGSSHCTLGTNRSLPRGKVAVRPRKAGFAMRTIRHVVSLEIPLFVAAPCNGRRSSTWCCEVLKRATENSRVFLPSRIPLFVWGDARVWNSGWESRNTVSGLSATLFPHPDARSPVISTQWSQVLRPE